MSEKRNIMWANLLHLGSNLWNDEGHSRHREHRSTPSASPVFLFDRKCWNDHTEELRKIGVNTLIIDIAEAMRYESHPEIAVEGAWDHDMMLAEIKRLTDMGFELVPKLNFSACHDVWLKEYSRMLSTSIYYKVCKDLIDEVCQLFKPRYFHLGMDEETYSNQRFLDFCCIRQFDLWWKDLYYLVDCVEKNNARAWVWSDFAWSDPDAFFSKMPKSVIQSNWYYSGIFDGPELTDGHKNRLHIYEKLDEAGYDQVPTGSVWSAMENFEGLTKYCTEHISDKSFMGMMQTTWERIDPNWMHVHEKAIKTITDAKTWYENR
ncbi:MAG: Tat pathway signal protein [Ruminococcaceae bacterium]|nr:Tat pathway signal protein [Oscillospiraceae bacterium]